MNTAAALSTEYPWLKEVEKTIIQSIASSFSIDFLLFQDRVGGNVDTVHNARRGIYATEKERDAYNSRPAYSSAEYHSHKKYIETNRQNKKLHEQGMLHDAYRNVKIASHEKINLDHVISAYEIHHDPGRILAGIGGAELANRSSNLQVTHESINKSKKAKPIPEYIEQQSKAISVHKNTLIEHQKKLEQLRKSPQKNKAEILDLESKISKVDAKIKVLGSLNKESMLKRDQEARSANDREINIEYYFKGSKFCNQLALTSAAAGVNMGVRQALGLICAEIWVELRQQISSFLEKEKKEFCLSSFFEKAKNSIKRIFQKIRKRFKELFIEFKDGFLSGMLSNVTTSIFNIFSTTGKNAIKIIRELWGSITKALKLIFFNPENLTWVDLGRAVTGVISVGVSTLVGSLVYAKSLAALSSMTYGSELAAFAGALTTGLLTLSLNYFLLHSRFAQKAWDYIKKITPYGELKEKYQEVNRKLDKYLIELAELEFNLDAEELANFASKLDASHNELDRSILLERQTKSMKIDLPFKPRDPQSTRKFLVALAKKN